MSLSYNVATAAMKMIGHSGFLGQLDALGISMADFKKFTGDAPWTSSDRHRMTGMLHALITGTVDALGLPRFMVTAEHMAAGIAVFVAPVNIHTACIYAPSTGEAEKMARGAEVKPVKPEQIAALVGSLWESQDRSDARCLFEKRVGIEIKKVEGMVTGGSKNG